MAEKTKRAKRGITGNGGAGADPNVSPPMEGSLEPSPLPDALITKRRAVQVMQQAVYDAQAAGVFVRAEKLINVPYVVRVSLIADICVCGRWLPVFGGEAVPCDHGQTA